MTALPPPQFLSQYLPDAGFQWITMHKTPFTTFEQCVAICGAMTRVGKPLTQSDVTQYIADIFITARAMAGQCGDMEPDKFWHKVASRRTWSYGLQGQDLFDFALRTMAARVTFRHRVRVFHQESNETGDIPPRYRNRDHSIANAAVDDWIATVIHSYGVRSRTRKVYCPDGLTEPSVGWAPIGAYMEAKMAGRTSIQG
ncbi:uncharacterized protein GGS22DRAFT_192231 [Annulohypoxylon maeteangense]|uniref:uncharacterized protein n=1 Tax=Annulohypoxylon maeteangense TaxID=1927788 RepID=UPI002007B016|nr:uncharacterized protein GGS22DRAFT_192231 [Annulohypoxylon maeteangense]KAI0881595.1 hypothetical protein GGS22DRAFT_192231 [Annulohypoxylon maeteangense]